MDTEFEMSQEEVTNKTIDKPWLFKKGNPGGPGRTPGKSLKEYSREYLASLTDKERQEYLEGLPKIEIWKMAEGQPHQTTDTTIEIKPTPLLDALRHNNGDLQDKPTEETN